MIYYLILWVSVNIAPGIPYIIVHKTPQGACEELKNFPWLEGQHPKLVVLENGITRDGACVKKFPCTETIWEIE